jgi:hypothetical protein
MKRRTTTPEQVQRLALEMGYMTSAAAFALGYCNGNYADAKAFLVGLNEDEADLDG